MRTVQICSYLSGQQTHSIVLKGQGIALYYPKPSLRVCGDIDIWVDAKRCRSRSSLHSLLAVQLLSQPAHAALFQAGI